MTRERWKQIEMVFEQALELPADQRPAFLQNSCDGDEELRREVQSLLDSHARAGSFIDERSLFVASDEGDERDAVVASGQLIGAYRVVRELGRGGMGAVYLAERADEQYRKRVAIKLIKRGMDTDAVLRRFRNERQILANFDHPNIARLFDAGTTDSGLPYFVMEYVEGVSIDNYCEAHALSVPDRLKLFREVCAAVAYAHRCGVIHRDIKSSNIVVTTEGVPKLVDFGIAKILRPAGGTETLLTTADLRPMTPQYASPEQVRGERLTPATDIYSLGIVLYELLTGQLPYRFTSQSPHDVARAITEQEPTRPSTAVAKRDGNSKFGPSRTGGFRNSKFLKGDLDNIVLKALCKEPELRYQSVEELSEDIRCHLGGRPIIARPMSAPARVWRWSRRNRVLAGAATACLLLAVAVVWLLRQQFLEPKNPPPQKSIAVLPFENLSRDPDNAFFTNGVQDEILTALARISDLKVISRTSVAEYKSGIARDLREIGEQLGVAHVLEGSVQRAGNRVRVNAQLVDTRTDAHMWAQSYDRDLADVFAIQTDIAKAIANQLQVKLSVSEQTAIAQPPTTDLTAFLLYNRAKSLLVLTTMSTGLEQKFHQAIDLLNQAVARDPSFFLAYCQLAYTHDHLYWLGFDHTPARLALADAAVQEAFRLRPNAGEAHLARGENLYRGHLDYNGALAELGLARRMLPNDPRIFELTGLIKSRQGKMEEALRNLQRALELDPRNLYTAQQIGMKYGALRRYAEEAAVLDRCLAIDPNNIDTRVARAALDIDWKADPRPLHKIIGSIRTENPAAVTTIADSWFACALAEHDASAAEAALQALGENTFGNDAVQLSRTFGEGLIARMTNDEVKARAAFTAARTEQEKRVQAQPNYGPALCILGLIDAGLGQKEDALREGRRAIELLPVEKDFINGVHMIEHFAIIAAWLGEKDLACEQLAAATQLPGFVSYGQLKLLPYWDPLRGDPCFEKIVASLAPNMANRVVPGRNAMSSVAKTTDEKSVAVLPFEYLSTDKSEAYLADGIQEEILTRLSKIADLKVISRTSTQRYKDSARDVREIAKQLGVAHVVEGSVQKVADQVRINVQLINAQTDAHLWADKFDRKLTDIFAVETEVATKIADILQAKLTDAEQRAIALRPTQNSEAHQAYLKGLYYWNRFLAPDFAKSRDYFQRAIDLDPSYAAAYARLALYYGFASGNGLMPPDEGWPKAEAAVNKALALDDTLAEAYNPLAAIKLYWYRDWPAAERAFRRGLELNPNVAEIHLHYALCLILFGHNEDASKEIQRGLELDPVSFPFNLNWARTLFFTRQYDRAIEQFRTALDLDPNYALPHQWLGNAYEKKQMQKEAITEWSKALSVSGGGEDASLLEQTYVSSGFDAAVRLLAQKQLERLKARTARGEYVPAVDYVTAYVRLGEKEQAFAWLAKAVEERNWFALHIKTNPMFDPLRGDPRFEKLANQIAPDVK